MNDKVIDENEIMTEYGVSQNYINRHSRAMGVFYHRRPRKYLRTHVEAHFEREAQKAMLKVATHPQRAAIDAMELRKIVDRISARKRGKEMMKERQRKS
jgi:hypothetical protein